MQEIISALCQFHLTVGKVTKNQRADRYRYADLATVLEVVREPLASNGLTVTQSFEEGQLVTTLWHLSGQHIQSSMSLPVLDARGLNSAQALGSAISYARRYALLALLNLAAEDDDGATADPAPETARRSEATDAVPF